MHFWDAGQSGFHLMIMLSFSNSCFTGFSCTSYKQKTYWRGDSTRDISIRCKNISCILSGQPRSDPVSPQCKQTLKQTTQLPLSPQSPLSCVKEVTTVCRETLRWSNKQTVTQSEHVGEEMVVIDKQREVSGSGQVGVFKQSSQLTGWE